MKLILKTDIEGLGDLGDVVDVKPGYARNYLLPRKFALKYNQHNLDQIKVKREKHQKKIELIKLSALDQKTKIEELVITISKQSGKKDTLFGSVKVIDIAKELTELGIEIENKNIKLDHPIKSLGDYSIPVKLFKEVSAQLQVKVVSKNILPEEPVVDEKPAVKEVAEITKESVEDDKKIKIEPVKKIKEEIKVDKKAAEITKEPVEDDKKAKDEPIKEVKKEKEEDTEEK